jgi:CRISPR-associated protein Cmr6
MKARRNVLQSVPKNAGFHIGLWLDKYLEEQYIANEHTAGSDVEKRAKSARSRHIKEIEKPDIPEGYKEAFARWQESMEESGCYLAPAKVQGRMIVGLGDKNPLEFGITLQHTWGVPYIPGSSLKGLASATAARLIANEDWQRSKPHPADAKKEENPQEQKEIPKTSADLLFGDTTLMGSVIFHDAWWIPDTGQTEAGKVPLHLDVMTVHHPDYYQKPPETCPPPSDTDSPNPVSFLSAGGSYLIALEGDQMWCNAAHQLLKIGLEELGIGAKTHSGYGRLALQDLQDNTPLTPEKWAEKEFSEDKDLDKKAQYDKLLALQKSPPSFPAELSEAKCKEALCAYFSEGYQLAQARASGESESNLDELKADLEALEQEKPSGKKDPKGLKNWEKKVNKLRSQIITIEHTEKNAANRSEEAKQLLAWLSTR